MIIPFPPGTMCVILLVALFLLPLTAYSSESIYTLQTGGFPDGGAARIEEHNQPEDNKQVEKHKKEKEQQSTVVQEPLYSAGPWTGRIIDTKTKMPIQGAVVAAVWYRMYDTRFTVFTDFHEAREDVTDENGYFEIPAYIEKGEHKEDWPKPDVPGVGGPIELIARGPIIKDPEFIIYKPSYNSYPAHIDLVIFAVRPFKVEFQEFYTEGDDGSGKTVLRKNIRDFPEGLVYAGGKCDSLLEKLSKKASFAFNSLFLGMNKAGEEIKRLNIPLDCPQTAEPLPAYTSGYRYDLEEPFKKGGYIIVELSGTTSDKERLKALPQEPAGASSGKLPHLYGRIQEERAYLKDKIQRR